MLRSMLGTAIESNMRLSLVHSVNNSNSESAGVGIVNMFWHFARLICNDERTASADLSIIVHVVDF